ncbi:MAG: ABC transporter ATP-binding protein/permease [Candidatus Babeliaceae bacterium]|nr:ABC transporter ATP-binding protein/permease [Candidatus Babeliaceae bacterium]
MFNKNTPPQTLSSFIWYFSKKRFLNLTLLAIAALVWALDISFRSYMLKILLDRIAAFESTYMLIIPALGYIFSSILLNASFRFYDIVRLHTIPLMQADITRTMTKYVQNHSYNFFQNHLSGSVANQIHEMCVGVREIIKIVIDRFFANFVALIIAAMTLSSISPIISMIIITWSIFFLWITHYLSSESNELAQKFSEVNNITMGNIVDSLINNMTVKLFARNTHELDNIQKHLNVQAQADKDLEWCMLKIRAIQGFAVSTLIGTLMCYLLYMRHYNLVTVGDFALTISIAIAISESILNLSEDFVTFSESVGQCKQSMELITQKHDILDHQDAQSLKIATGAIRIENMTFSHASTMKVFDDLSIEITGGEKVGIVGFSGSGKSTFVNLITRIFEPQKGRIFIDNQDISLVTQDSLRECIGFVQQDPILFRRSIRENILYGNPHASNIEVIEAAKKAFAHDFIMNLPEGYDTLLSERGVSLSGGQRQRISLARAFLKNAPILIIDEGTASLDSETESLIHKSLESLMHNKTVLIISHRLSISTYLDRILVFDDGRIIQDGNPEALKNIPGVYAQLRNTQI